MPIPGDSSLSALSSDIDVPAYTTPSLHPIRHPQHRDKGIYCHHCHRRCDASNVLRCTDLKQLNKRAPARPCNRAFCVRDLRHRYNTDASEIIKSEQYSWSCPCCRGVCQESSCRKKSLETANVATKPNQFVTPVGEESISTVGSKKRKQPATLEKEMDTKTVGARTKLQQPKEQRAKKEVPDPPVFEKIDTRLGYEGVLRRIQLREYLFRFRATLCIPERSLFAVDDFDRPLTEASVRLFGGAMLDMIKDEVEDEAGELFKYREEIRYYADLARFTAIFTLLTEPLGLKMSSPDSLDGGRQASRLPQADDVLRMLLALAERTLQTPLIRTDIDSTAGEGAERRQHAKDLKAEGVAWEKERKRLSSAGLQAKTPIEGRQNKEDFKRAQKEHELRVALLNVNLRAVIGRRAIRHEPLGSDHDGRVYYTLSTRPIDEGKPPLGWASGLLVWGKGVSDEDDLRAHEKRWSHFGGSASVRQLIQWLRYRERTPRKFAVVVPQKRLVKPVSEQSEGLLAKLGEVAEWLEVLEWKGLGEM